MPVDDGRDIIIASDFHMSSGYDAAAGAFSRNEDFFYADGFGRFIDHLISQADAEDRRWRLVILGDFVDFLQVDLAEGEPGGGATSREAVMARLRIIGDGHPAVFTALARFVNAGHAIDIVLGNHDIELIWPEVQQTVRQMIVDAGADEAAGTASIAFHPWIFYVPGVLYAEHGQQYDAINSFPTLLEPFLPGQPDLI